MNTDFARQVCWLASVTPVVGPHNGLYEARLHHIARRDGDTIWLGTRAERPMPATVLLELMLMVDALVVNRSASLTWAFSSIVVPVADLRGLAEAWGSTGEPPVVSIIDLQLGDDRHLTHGLIPFLGHELEVRFGDPVIARDAARNLMRLARHALATGELLRRLDYTGVDGEALELRWSMDDNRTIMVTILL